MAVNPVYAAVSVGHVYQPSWHVLPAGSLGVGVGDTDAVENLVVAVYTPYLVSLAGLYLLQLSWDVNPTMTLACVWCDSSAHKYVIVCVYSPTKALSTRDILQFARDMSPACANVVSSVGVDPYAAKNIIMHIHSINNSVWSRINLFQLATDVLPAAAIAAKNCSVSIIDVIMRIHAPDPSLPCGHVFQFPANVSPRATVSVQPVDIIVDVYTPHSVHQSSIDLLQSTRYTDPASVGNRDGS